MSLNEGLIRKIRHICSEGYGLYDKGHYKEALREFYKAWTLIPKPQTDNEEAGWVLTAIGDCYFRNEQWEQGRESLNSALHCPHMKGNPFIHLRLGQCLYELNDKEAACDHLQQAYLNGGRKLFQNEAPKYLIEALST